MTTTVLPDTDSITHLDFEASLPCDIWVTERDQCEDAAEWTIRVQCIQCHHSDRLLLCSPHKTKLLEVDSIVTGQCEHCGCYAPPRLLAVEPLR